MRPSRVLSGRMSGRVVGRLRRARAGRAGPGADPGGDDAGGTDAGRTSLPALAARVAALEAAVDENRRLNQRLADVVDVVTEVLVPAADRDDERMRAALDRLNATLDDGPTA